MALREFGTENTKIFLLLPGTSCTWEINFNKLPVNQYYKHTETKAPDGYNLIIKDTYFRIGKKNNDDKWSVIWTDDKGKDLKDGEKYVNVAENGACIIEDPETSSEETEGTEASGEEDRIKTYSTTIKVPNAPGRALPSTGGPGRNLFYLLGTILVFLAGTGLVMQRRKS